MNAGGPTCASCGALNVNAQSPQCRFCGQMLPQMAPPQPYAGYGAPAGGYGAPQPYGQPQPYGPAPGYGPAQNPYGAPVQPFNQGFAPQYVQSSWASGWSTIFWVRLGIAAIAISLSLLGACVSALSH